jgi:hypothetical protein
LTGDRPDEAEKVQETETEKEKEKELFTEKE